MAGMRVRMAAALAANDQKWRHRQWPQLPRSIKDMFLADIDAILAVMPEPTDEMLDGFGIHAGRMRINWAAMISAIKAERFADPIRGE